MKKIIQLLIPVLICYNAFSQEKKETVYLLFNPNSTEKCFVEDGDGNKLKLKKFRKKVWKKNVSFFICDEFFLLDKKEKIDTCNIEFRNRIKFETIESIEKKRLKTKHINVFKNSVFKNIYLVELYKNKIIKYPVVWNTDLIQK